MGENEMKPKLGLPQNVRLSEWLGITGVNLELEHILSTNKLACKICGWAAPKVGAIYPVLAIGFHLNSRTQMGGYGTPLQLLNQQGRIAVRSSWALCQNNSLLCSTSRSRESNSNRCRECLSSQSDLRCQGAGNDEGVPSALL